MLAKGRLSAALTRPVITADDLGLRTILLREERLGAIVPATQRLADRRSITWKELAREPLIVLARREGVGLHDAVLANCRQAGFLPRLAHTPSLIGTVLSYVEAGAGVGVVPECVLTFELPLRFVPLLPKATVPLVLAWPEDHDPPPVQRFRELIVEWQENGKLWPNRRASSSATTA
jgi:DNA-binding transcriptional LysR family regulator